MRWRWIVHECIPLTPVFPLPPSSSLECTPADDKLRQHRTAQIYHHRLSPMFHCSRPPVCQRSLQFDLNCLPASGLHLKGEKRMVQIIIPAMEKSEWHKLIPAISSYAVDKRIVHVCSNIIYTLHLLLTCSADQGNILWMVAIFNSDTVSRTINESALSSWATKLIQPCPSAWWCLRETYKKEIIIIIALAI